MGSLGEFGPTEEGGEGRSLWDVPESSLVTSWSEVGTYKKRYWTGGGFLNHKKKN